MCRDNRLLDATGFLQRQENEPVEPAATTDGPLIGQT
jgi:hypothetical protein